MRHRMKTKTSLDRRYFARTGMRTKKINVSPKIQRGGTML